MLPDASRISRLQDAMGAEGWDALVCALPMNVLLLTGYWPIVGLSIAIATRDGEVVVLAPEDEANLAGHGWGRVRPFVAGSLEEILPAVQAVRPALREVIGELGLELGHIGQEQGPVFVPASYASMHLYGSGLAALLREVSPRCSLHSADALLERQRTVKTTQELIGIRTACRIAEQAFDLGVQQMRPGLCETEAAEAFRAPLATGAIGFRGGDGFGNGGTSPDRVRRAGGFVFCMSGLNSAAAHGAYARSRVKRLATGNLVLTHCNSYADGFWTDITRTYCLGDIEQRKQRMYQALFEARAAALGKIRPGARAADIDAAARRVLGSHGFAEAFNHPTGHGVGFAAINHNARPRLHPRSEEILEEGMVFNVEPGIYLDGFGGMRHCDMVAVTADGYELLTPFQSEAMALMNP
jgi:Xaa-Pro aminopeptidase